MPGQNENLEVRTENLGLQVPQSHQGGPSIVIYVHDAKVLKQEHS